MRKVFVAGNWKMNLDLAGAKALAGGLREKIDQSDWKDKIEVAVCPPFVYLPSVVEALAGSSIGMGAQDVYFEGNGAYTGEISVEMLQDVGCEYVIVGHSERRHVLGESNDLINKKLKAALAGGLAPILCIGEMLSERESDLTEAVVERQLRQGLAEVSAEDLAKITLAYEPVWAIGTGVTATPEQAQEAHHFSRGIIQDMYGAEAAAAIRIQYGGSVKPTNAQELIGQPDVDGGLIGGASLKVEDFLGILAAGAQVS
jgi:triosephosphate isomerase (TIM)